MAHNRFFLLNYGLTLTLNAVKADGTARDISLGTTLEFMFLKPDGTATPNQTAAFVTDGTDGKLIWTVAQAFFDVAGTWKVRMRVTQTNPAAQYSGEWEDLEIEP